MNRLNFFDQTREYYRLWAISNKFEQEILRLLVSYNHQHYNLLLNLITSAIKPLELILNNPTRIDLFGDNMHFAPPVIEVETRIKLALIYINYAESTSEAELHLQKALLICPKEMPQLLFRIKRIQASILEKTKSFTAAKILLKQAHLEATEQQDVKWIYTFIQQRASISFLEGDFKGCFKLLQLGLEEAEKRKDLNFQAFFLILKAQKSLIFGENEMQVTFSEISKFNEFEGISVDLKLYLEILLVIFYSISGDFSDALQILRRIHSKLESVEFHEKSSDLESGHCFLFAEKQESVAVKIFSKPQLLCLVYYYSGVVFKPGETFKAKKFLNEGLKVIEACVTADAGNFTLQSVIEGREWFYNMKAMYLIQLIEICVTRSEYEEAFKFLTMAVEFCVLFKLWDFYAKRISFLFGIYYQCLKKKKQAVEWLELALSNKSKDEQIDNFCLFNLVILLQSDQKVEDLMARLETIPDSCINNCLKETAKGLHCFSQQQITLTKCHLLQTLKASEKLTSNHLKYFSLTVLGRYFMDTVPEQAEKMLVTAYQLAKKAKNDEICGICCTFLERIYFLKTGDPNNQQQWEKYSQLETLHFSTKQKLLKTMSDKFVL